MNLKSILQQLPDDYQVELRPIGGDVSYTDTAQGWLESDGLWARLGDFELVTPIVLPGDKPVTPESNGFAGKVAAEVEVLKIRDAARRRFAQETSPPPDLPPMLTLRQRLAAPQPPIVWRIDGWQPAGTRVLLAAQYKAGKTTLTGNLARCLVDSQPWLGLAQVAPMVTGTVTILDFEMSERQIDGWLADQQIQNDDKVTVIPLRGRATAFDILSETGRREWSRHLHGTEYLILDCLRPVLDAFGLDENREGGRFLTAFDALCELAEITDSLVVHHMGHQGERSRGDSRFRDWPDVEWRLVRQDHDDPASPRFLSAFGRDVDQPEGALIHDPSTRHITWEGGSRASVVAREALTDVLDVLRNADEPLSQRALLRLIRDSDHSRPATIEAMTLGEQMGLIHVNSEGRGRPKLHHHIERCAGAQDCAAAQSARYRAGAQVPIGTARTYAAVDQSFLEDEFGAVLESEVDPW